MAWFPVSRKVWCLFVEIKSHKAYIIIVAHVSVLCIIHVYNDLFMGFDSTWLLSVQNSNYHFLSITHFIHIFFVYWCNMFISCRLPGQHTVMNLITCFQWCSYDFLQKSVWICWICFWVKKLEIAMLNPSSWIISSICDYISSYLAFKIEMFI